MAFEKVIVLDDEPVIRRALEENLRRRRYSVATASTIADAEALVAGDHFDLMFVDVRLPDGDGTELLARLAETPGSPLVVMMTGYGTVESAVECMRTGAFDYILKPFSIDHIEVVLKKAEAYSQLVKVNRYLSAGSGEAGEGALIGQSLPMVQLQKMIKKVAATEATVLVTGENGTGKEMIAQDIFRLSGRSDRPFIKVNCAAISENLIESEFFGHEKGAFTGATQRREGRFELANGGTLLLDEIGEISPAIQVKLLRVLQEREFERVGGNRTIRVDVRVIATTNRHLAASVARGDFREDLYYRLNVFPLHAPPLRDRTGDILLLAEGFLERFGRKHGIRSPGFSERAAQRLLEHAWPGNVRELENTVERAVILTENQSPVSEQALGLYEAVAPRVVPPEPQPSLNGNGDGNGPPLGRTPAPVAFPGPPDAASTAAARAAAEAGAGALPSLDDMERGHILAALRQTGGNRKEASAILKISPRTLRNKIQQYRGEGVEIP